MDLRHWVLTLGAVQALACAHTPPGQLVDARDAYERAASVPAPATKLRSEQLRSANVALLQAEYVFEQDGDTAQARELSSLALRRSRRAELDARRAQRDARRAERDARRAEAEQPEGEADEPPPRSERRRAKRRR